MKPRLSYVLGAVGLAGLLLGFCAGRGSRLANDRAVRAWLDSAPARDSELARLRARSAADSARADSLAAVAARPAVIVRTVIQRQLDTATTARDSLVLLVAQRDSLERSVSQWALAFAAVTASRNAERDRAERAEAELLRAQALLLKARAPWHPLGIRLPSLPVAGALVVGGFLLGRR